MTVAQLAAIIILIYSVPLGKCIENGNLFMAGPDTPFNGPRESYVATIYTLARDRPVIGGNIRRKCVASPPYRPWFYRWEHPDETKTTGQYLNVRSITRNQFGIYKCVASEGTNRVVAFTAIPYKSSTGDVWQGRQPTYRTSHSSNSRSNANRGSKLTNRMNPPDRQSGSGTDSGTLTLIGSRSDPNRKHKGSMSEEYWGGGTREVVLEILVQPGEILKPGGRVRRLCKVNYPGYRLHWVYPDGSIVQGPLLILNNINRQYAGTYTCIADNGKLRLNATVTMSFKSRIFDNIGGVIQTQYKGMISLHKMIGDNYVVGGSVRRECRVAKPGWKIVWIYPNKTVVDSPILFIRKLGLQHAGIYQCVATLRGEKMQITFPIGFDQRYAKLTIKRLDGDRLTYGGMMNRLCEINDKGWELYWESPDRSKIRSTYITINNLRTAHNGRYKCHGRNHATGTALVTWFDVYVRKKPPKMMINLLGNDEIKVGGTVSRQCIVDGPGWYIYWTRPDGSRMNGTFFIISNLQPVHNGRYTCHAEHWSTGATISSHFVVNVRPVVPEATMTIKVLDGDRPVAGGELRRHCIVNQMGWEFYWVKADGTRYNNPYIIVSNLRSSHSGRYTCYAQRPDTGARLRQSFDIRIRDQKPKINIRVLDSDNLKFGGAIRRQCEVDQPGWEVYWTLPNRGRVESSYLIIDNLQPTHNGRYTCHVRHQYSRAAYTSEFSVDIVVPRPNVQIRVLEGDELKYNGRIRRRCISDKPGSIQFWILPNKTRVDSSYVAISNLRSLHNGLYICKVKYAEGVEPVTAQFAVNIADREAKIDIANLDGDRIAYDGILRRVCTVNEHGWDITWTLADGSSQDTSFFTLPNLRPSHSGVYRCTARHPTTGRTLYSQFSINIVEPQASIRITKMNGDQPIAGGTLRRRCTVSPESGWTIYWTLPDGKRIYRSDLVIPALHSSNSRTYTCSAYNSASGKRLTDSFTVSIKGARSGGLRPPEINIRRLRGDQVKVGGTLLRQCTLNVLGWRVYWILPNGGRIDGSRLSVPNLDTSNSGKYTCHAVQTATGIRLKESFSINIAPAPVQATIDIRRIDGDEAEEGGSIRRRCIVNKPGWNIYWTLPNGKRIDSSYVIVSDLQAKHNGKYTCYAYQPSSGMRLQRSFDLSIVSTPAKIDIKRLDGDRIESGGSIRRRCSINKLNWDIYWILPDGTKVESTYVTVSDLKSSHSGKYTCYAVKPNTKSLKSSSFDINIIDPQVNVNIKTLDGERLIFGGALRRQCKVSSPDWEVYWVRPNGRRVESSYIVINDLQVSHNGKYTCHARHPQTGATKSTYITVNVTPIQANINIKKLDGDEVKTGGAIRRQCTVNAPGWDVYWTKPNGKRVPSSYIVVYDLQATNNGKYTCHARHPSSGATKSASFSINLIPIEVKVSVKILDGDNIKLGGAMRRQCKVSAPDWEVYWTLPDGTRKDSSYVVISDLQSTHNGQYTCHARQPSSGATKTSWFPVNIASVQGKLEVKTLDGDSLTLDGAIRRQCKINLPGWNLYWTKPDGSRVESSYIIVSRLKLSHNGKYTCHAEKPSTKGKLTSDFNVNIIPKKPTITIRTLSDDRLVYGGSIRRICMIQNPKWRVHWILPDGGRLDRTYLSISNLKAQHSGQYTCYGTSLDDGSSVRKSFSVNIPPVPPRIKIRRLSADRLVYGGAIARKCEVNEKGWTVYWVLPDGTRVESDHLTISNLEKLHNGQYTCHAMHKKTGATFSSWFTLSINARLPKITIESLKGDSLTSGGQIHRKCFVNQPGWVVFWTRPDGTKVVNSVLRLQNIRSSDNGQYTCYAKKTATGTALTSWFDVNVKEPVSTVFITVKPRLPERLIPGGEVHRECKVAGSDSKPQWKTPSGNIIQSPNLDINNLGSRDMGRYTCSSADVRGKKVVSDLQLKQKGRQITASVLSMYRLPQERLIVGGVLHRRCVSPGNDWSVSWILPNNQRVNSDILLINNLKPSDMGLYKCEARRGDDSIRLYVNVKPQAKKRDDTTKINIQEVNGENTAFDGTLFRHCQVNERGWVMYWTLPDGSRIEGYTLKIPNLRPTHSGRYTCHAMKPSTGDKMSSSFSILIKPPEVLYISDLIIRPRNIENLVMGGTLRRRCYSETTKLKIHWKTPSRGIVTGENLDIDNLGPNDLGEYVCMGINKRGKKVVSSLVLNQNGSRIVPKTLSVRTLPSDRIQLGGTLHRQCIAPGRNWNVSWLLPGAKGLDSDTLMIKDLMNDHKGVYQCYASQGRQNLRYYFRLNSGKPKGGEEVKISIRPQIGDRLTYGGSVKRQCKVSEPGWLIFWTKPDGSRVEGSYVSVFNLKASHNGQYTCHARKPSTGRSMRSWFQVAVTKPRPTPNPQIKVYILDGDSTTYDGTVRRQCVVSEPGWKIVWITPNGTKIDDSYILIANLRPHHNGHYTCHAKKMSTGDTLKTWFSIALNVNAPARVAEINVYTLNGDSITYGGKVRRQCVVNEPGWTILWIFPNGTRVNTPYLLVFPLKPSNNGQYTCLAQKSGSTLRSQFRVKIKNSVATVFITVKPRLPERLIPGGEVHRECKVAGSDSKPQWKTPSGNFIQSPNLDINNLGSRDMGRYTCSSADVRGKKVVSDLQLKQKGRRVTASVLSMQNLPLDRPVVGGALHRRCIAPDKDWSVSWILPNNQRVNSDILLVNNLKTSDMGMYKCEARRDGDIIRLYFNVFPKPPETQSVGERIQILKLYGENLSYGGTIFRVCQVSEPGWTIIWKLPDKRILRNSRIRIDDLSRTHAGSYVCEARKGNKEMYTGFNITFRKSDSKSSGTTRLTLQKLSGDNFVFGGTMRRRCVVSSSGWNVAWLYPNGTTVNSAILYISKLADTHAGQYTCVATKGKARMEMIMDISFPKNTGLQRAKISIEKAPGDNLSYGGTVSRQCRVSEPGWKITWQYPDGSIVDSQNLYLTKVSESHAGTYTCIARRGQIVMKMTFKIAFQATPSMSTVYINVRPRLPERLYLGGQIHRVCTVEGSDWKTLWKTPTGLMITGSRLDLTDLDGRHLGTYTCAASSKDRRVIYDLQVRQNNRQIETQSLRLRVLPSEKLETGGILHRRCLAPDPSWKVSWVFPDGRKVDYDILLVRPLDHNNAGVYKCEARKGKDLLRLYFLFQINQPKESFAILRIGKLAMDNPRRGGVLARTCQINATNWDTMWQIPDGQIIPSKTLFMYNLQTKNNGRYLCIAKERGTSRRREAFFHVDISPPIRITNITLKDLPGHNVVYKGIIHQKCEVSEPGWVIEWQYPNGRAINSPVLFLRDLRAGHSGQYTCNAKNPKTGAVLKAFMNANVNDGGYTGINFNPLPGENLVAGGMIHKRCVVMSQYWRVYWTKPDGSRIDGTTLAVSNLGPEHSGKYTCHAVNTISGRTASSSFTIYLRDAVRSDIKIVSLSGESLMFGGSVKRQCKVTTPGWTFYWVTPTGKRINSDFLEIKGLNLSHSGKYTCHASHTQTGDRLSAWFEFRVRSVAVLRMDTMPDQRLVVGGTLSQKCSVNKPGWIIKWTLPNGEVRRSENIRIPNLNSNHYGMYWCIATNAATQETKRAYYKLG